MKPTLSILVGPPGSGKSTWAANQNTKIVSTDKIREEINGDANNQDKSDKVFEIFYSRIELLLAAGFDCIADSCAARPKYRTKLVEIAKKCGAAAVCVWFDMELETCLERNMERDRQVPHDVICNMWTNLLIDGPNYQEGFDSIVVHNEGTIFVMPPSDIKSSCGWLD